MHWSGKIALKPQKPLCYLVDNDMSPDIAEALRLFNRDIIHFKSVPEFKNRPEGVEDPEIIEWCRVNGRLWITHDKEARKQYEVDLKSARINVLWLRGSPQEFAAWRQFKVVVRIIDKLEAMIQSSRGAMHFRAGLKGTPTPEVIWTELPRDMPRRESPKEKLGI